MPDWAAWDLSVAGGGRVVMVGLNKARARRDNLQLPVNIVESKLMNWHEIWNRTDVNLLIVSASRIRIVGELPSRAIFIGGYVQACFYGSWRLELKGITTEPVKRYEEVRQEEPAIEKPQKPKGFSMLDMIKPGRKILGGEPNDKDS